MKACIFTQFCKSVAGRNGNAVSLFARAKVWQIGHVWVNFGHKKVKLA